jgi:RHS repeat-associated protein
MLPNRQTLLCRYHYDPLDRLVDCTLTAQAGTQRFYLKDRLATEIQGTAQRSIMQHDDQLLAQQQRQSGVVDTRLLVTDQQRSVLNVVDAIRINPLAYSPYGHRPVESGLLSLLGFNGERPDPVTGCYLLGNGYRAFNPVLMRFNSPDSWSPFGEGGLNTYQYCIGDPLNRVDRTGHAPLLLVKISGFSDFIGDVLKTATLSLHRRNGAVGQPISAPRQYVMDVVDALNEPQPFVKRLRDVNSNLASHGNDTLSMEHALKYEQLVQQVESGNLSNTAAHVESATMWAKKYVQDRRPSGVVGFTFNGVGGTLLSGVHDHALQKTGRALRQATS